MVMDELKDKHLKSLLKESKVEMPFSDFESKMISRVNSELNGKRTIIKNLRLSWFFFFIGSVFGLGISLTLPLLNLELGGIETHHLKYPVMILVLFVIIWQLDEMVRLTIRQRKEKRMY